MTTRRRLSTLHLLGLFVFTALALNDDRFIVGVGSFKLSPFDLLFVAMLGVKALRLADPGAYALPRGALGVLLGIQAISVIYLLLVSIDHPGIQTGDVIVSVNDKPVHDASDAKAAVASAAKSGRKSVLLLIERGGNKTFVAVPFSAA